MRGRARWSPIPDAATRPRRWLVGGRRCQGSRCPRTTTRSSLAVPLAASSRCTDAGAARLVERAPRAALGGASARAIGFVAGSPFLLVEPHTALRDIVANRQIVMDRAVAGGGAFASLGAYLRMLETDAIGWPVSLAAATGLVVAFVTDWRKGAAARVVPDRASAHSGEHRSGQSVSESHAALRSRSPPDSRSPGPPASPAASASSSPAFLGVAAALPGLLGSLRSDRFFLDRRHADAGRGMDRARRSGRIVDPDPALQRAPPPVARGADRSAAREPRIARRAPRRSSSLQLAAQSVSVARVSNDLPRRRRQRSGQDLHLARRVHDSGGLAPLRDRQVTYVVLKLYNVRGFVGGAAASGARAGRASRRHVLTVPRGRRRRDRASVPPFLHNTDARIDPALERPGPIIEIWRID